jgi:hypothetical protein
MVQFSRNGTDAPSFFQTGEGAFKGVVVLPVQQSGIDICGLLWPR